MKSLILLSLVLLSGSKVKHLSMINLIANPAEHFRDSLKVCGYLSFKFEDKSLWLSEEAFKNNVTPNSISIELMESDSLFSKIERVLLKGSKKEKPGLDGKHACIEGWFHESPISGEVGAIKAYRLRIILNETIARELISHPRHKRP